jgi:DNA polymerase III sliding clamp (beta) subunit (PCNA family)
MSDGELYLYSFSGFDDVYRRGPGASRYDHVIVLAHNLAEAQSILEDADFREFKLDPHAEFNVESLKVTKSEVPASKARVAMVFYKKGHFL